MNLKNRILKFIFPFQKFQSLRTFLKNFLIFEDFQGFECSIFNFQKFGIIKIRKSSETQTFWASKFQFLNKKISRKIKKKKIIQGLSDTQHSPPSPPGILQRRDSSSTQLVASDNRAGRREIGRDFFSNISSDLNGIAAQTSNMFSDLFGKQHIFLSLFLNKLKNKKLYLKSFFLFFIVIIKYIIQNYKKKITKKGKLKNSNFLLFIKNKRYKKGYV